MEESSKQSTEIWNVTVIGRKRKEKKTEEQSQKSLEISPNYAKLLREVDRIPSGNSRLGSIEAITGPTGKTYCSSPCCLGPIRIM